MYLYGGQILISSRLVWMGEILPLCSLKAPRVSFYDFTMPLPIFSHPLAISQFLVKEYLKSV